MQIEPIVVQIDKLDIVLEENDDVDVQKSSSRYVLNKIDLLNKYYIFLCYIRLDFLKKNYWLTLLSHHASSASSFTSSTKSSGYGLADKVTHIVILFYFYVDFFNALDASFCFFSWLGYHDTFINCFGFV